ncbi:hypothetical protein PFISCL1PPCAC_11813, partial [Pristionchus fissidentatus]
RRKKAKIIQVKATGQRKLMAGNFDSASENFGQAAQFSTEFYGEFAAGSFEPNFMVNYSLPSFSYYDSEMADRWWSWAQAWKEEAKGDRGDRSEENDGNESMTEKERDEVRDMVADAPA